MVPCEKRHEMILDLCATAFLAFCGIRWGKKGIYPVLKNLGKWGILFCLAFVFVTWQKADNLLLVPVFLFISSSGLGNVLSSQLVLIVFKVALLIVSLLFLEWIFGKKPISTEEIRSWKNTINRAGGMFIGLLFGILWLLVLQGFWLFYQGGYPEFFWIGNSYMFLMGENVLQNLWYLKDSFSLPYASLRVGGYA